MKNLICLTQRDEYPFSKPSLRYWLTKNLITFLTIILIILPQQGCNTTEPTLEPELKLELEDVSCTEAWIQLTTNNIQLPATINLLKNNSISRVFVLNTQDSLLYIDSLLPNQNYFFQVSHIVAGSIQHPVSSIVSNKVAATTLDTTSHNFTWQTFTFGQHSSSSLYDVAIIDENNIWAVGAIYMNDSLGRPDPKAYNAVHWDGTKWELKRIFTYSSCNPVDYAPLKAIWVISDTNIVVTSGGSIGWFNGKINKLDCNIRPLLTGSINKLWGSSSEDLYAVGNNGNIAHWDGKKWTKIESGTTLNINDIWGDYNQKTGEWEILAVASNYGTGLEKEILQIKYDSVIKHPLSSQMWPLLSVWFIPGRTYYVAGAGIYQKKKLNDAHWENSPLDITTYSTTSIRGSEINNVIGVGAYGDLIHFNGISWKNDYEEPVLSNGSYTKVALRNNLVVAVGGNQTSINSEAVILFVRR